MENRDILEEQRKELLEMFSHQQNKWAELNRMLIWIIISAFAGEVAVELLGKVSNFSKTLLILLFCTALVSYAIEAFRHFYCFKGYYELADKINQGLETNEYKNAGDTDTITKVGFKCLQWQAVLFVIVIAEFFIYGLSLLK